MNKPEKYLAEVRDQYENYPYPLRDPKDEKKRLLSPIIDGFEMLNHYCFSGKRNFSDNFRVLVAGGGTGDSIIFLAEQLRDSNAEIFYLDISESSMEIAKQRAKTRGLENINWHLASLLDLPKLNLGKFDYINCSGVLHHLEDPDAGLAALNSVLADDGVMGLMVYGKYGRTGVYQMQELMSLVNSKTDNQQEKVDNCNSILNSLPNTNWFMRGKDNFNDLSFGDVGIYDLFLHSQDCAYTIPELYEFVVRENLKIIKLVDDYNYNPRNYIKDKTVLSKINKLDNKDQFAIGELISGICKTHTLYAARKAPILPGINDLDMVPCFSLNNEKSIYEAFYNLAKKANGEASFKAEGTRITFPVNEGLIAALKYMDGEKTLKEIYKNASLKGKTKRPEIIKDFEKFYQIMSERQLLFLRYKDVPTYKTVGELQSQIK